MANAQDDLATTVSCNVFPKERDGMMSVTTIRGRLAALAQTSDNLTVELKRRDSERVASATPAPDGSFQMIGLEVAPRRCYELLPEIQRSGIVVKRVPVARPRWLPEADLEVNPRAWSHEPVYRVRSQLRRMSDSRCWERGSHRRGPGRQPGEASMRTVALLGADARSQTER
jgi:hypothetical protein